MLISNNYDLIREREAHTALRESHVHLQKTNQHLEKELGKRKEKESELLTFSEKLSSSNAQLMTEKGVLEGQLSSLEVDMCGLRDELRLAHQRREEQENELSELQQTSHSEISVLMNQLQDRSKAGIPYPLSILRYLLSFSSIASSIVPTLLQSFPLLSCILSHLHSLYSPTTLPSLSQLSSFQYL